MTPNDLQRTIHKKILRLRSIERLLIGESFKNLWNQSDSTTQERLIKLVEADDKYGVLKWLQNHPSIDLSEKPTHVLKAIASKLQVPNYSRLSKVELLTAIASYEKDSK